MFHDPTPQLAGLVAAWVTALLFGILLVLSIGYLWLLYSRGMRSKQDRVFFTLVVFQLLVAAAHMSVCFQQAVYGFTIAVDPLAYFGSTAIPSHIAQTTLYLINNLLADAVLVWRLYIVWNRNLYLCVPFIFLFILDAVLGFYTVHLDLQVVTLQSLFIRVYQWSIATWAVSITVQVSATCLIAWKVWITQRASPARLRSSHSLSVFWMILESGAILSFSSTLLLIFFALKKETGAIMIAIIGQLAALVPTSILFRVVLNKIKVRSGSTFETSNTRPSAITLHGRVTTKVSESVSGTAGGVESIGSAQGIELNTYKCTESLV